MRLWPALDIHPAAGAGDLEDLQGAILAALDDSGVSAVQELPLGWRIFFTTPAARDDAADVLRSWDTDLAFSPVDVSDEDWARRSQDSLGPVRVGRIRISPPWAAEQERVGGELLVGATAPGVIDIVIQPSMGFGTGHHATTRLCIALLQQVELVGRRVLDVGTGSGVLAIVASRLGADFVLAVDDDADALQSAQENLDLNAITNGVTLRRADFRELEPGSCDVVTANLTGALLIRGVEPIVASVAPAGRLVLSGITADEEATVRGVYEGRLPLIGRLDEEGWVALLLGR